MGCFNSFLEGRALSRPAMTERGPPKPIFLTFPLFPYSIIPPKLSLTSAFINPRFLVR